MSSKNGCSMISAAENEKKNVIATTKRLSIERKVETKVIYATQ